MDDGKIHHECTRALVELIEAMADRCNMNPAKDAFELFAENVRSGEQPELEIDDAAWRRVEVACSNLGT